MKIHCHTRGLGNDLPCEAASEVEWRDDLLALLVDGPLDVKGRDDVGDQVPDIPLGQVPPGTNPCPSQRY